MLLKLCLGALLREASIGNNNTTTSFHSSMIAPYLWVVYAKVEMKMDVGAQQSKGEFRESILLLTQHLLNLFLPVHLQEDHRAWGSLCVLWSCRCETQPSRSSAWWHNTKKKSTNCFARGAAVWTRWMSYLEQSVECVHHNVDVQAHFIFSAREWGRAGGEGADLQKNIVSLSARSVSRFARYLEGRRQKSHYSTWYGI